MYYNENGSLFFMDFNQLVTLHIKILNQILRFKKMTISHFYKTCVSIQNTNLDLHHFNFLHIKHCFDISIPLQQQSMCSF